MSRPNDNISENKSTGEPSGAKLKCDSRLVRSASVNLKYESPYLHKSAVYARYRRNMHTSRVAPGGGSLTSRPVSSSPSDVAGINQPKGRTGEVPAETKESAISTYPTSSQYSKGKMLLINITFRDTKDYRSGASLDEENLVSVFTNLGFDICKHRDLNKDDMMSRVKHFRDEELKSSPDVIVVVIMSHGGNRKAIANTSIVTFDEQMVDAEDILDLFNNSQCKSMAGKPKIFIFQCCRGEYYQFEIDSVPLTPKAPVTDALIAYSTLPGFVSYRNEEKGSWYISTFCEVFTRHAHEHHVEDLFKIVDNKMAEMEKRVKQRASFENRGFNKHCYLTPTSRK